VCKAASWATTRSTSARRPTSAFAGRKQLAALPLQRRRRLLAQGRTDALATSGSCPCLHRRSTSRLATWLLLPPPAMKRPARPSQPLERRRRHRHDPDVANAMTQPAEELKVKAITRGGTAGLGSGVGDAGLGAPFDVDRPRRAPRPAPRVNETQGRPSADGRGGDSARRHRKPALCAAQVRRSKPRATNQQPGAIGLAASRTSCNRSRVPSHLQRLRAPTASRSCRRSGYRARILEWQPNPHL
jgi:hypothetical protein